MSSTRGGAWNQCYASCPASTVTIQPPPFVLTIPGPALYCPDQPFQIEQHNPCANVLRGSSEGSNRSLFASSNFYTQALPSSNYSNYCSTRSCF